MRQTCTKCGATEQGSDELNALWYHVQHKGEYMDFCCRLHLIHHLAPELKQAVVIEQWVPTTQEEIDRMSQ